VLHMVLSLLSWIQSKWPILVSTSHWEEVSCVQVLCVLRIPYRDPQQEVKWLQSHQKKCSAKGHGSKSEKYSSTDTNVLMLFVVR